MNEVHGYWPTIENNAEIFRKNPERRTKIFPMPIFILGGKSQSGNIRSRCNLETGVETRLRRDEAIPVQKRKSMLNWDIEALEQSEEQFMRC
jgi:hypothetical protein